MTQHQGEHDNRLTRAEFKVSGRALTNVFLGGLLILAAVFALYFGKQLLLPIIIAVLLNYLLNPIVRGLLRFGIPRPVSAVGLILGLIAIALVGSYYLTQPALQFFSQLPHRLLEIEFKFRDIIRPVQEMAEAAEEIEKATGNGEERQTVTIRGPGLIEIAVGYARSFGAGALMALILLLFLLSLNEIFLHKLVRIMPTLRDKKRAVEITRQIERDVSRYLLTVTVINSLLGLTTGVALWLLGVDDPILWGVFVAVMNYIPYLGAMVSLVVLSLVSVGSFDESLRMLWPPLVFLVITNLEAYVITPHVVGNRLNLNPVLLIIALAFWGFIWGLAGMLIAVPLLVIMRLVCDRFESLAPIAEFLGGEPVPLQQNDEPKNVPDEATTAPASGSGAAT